MTSQIQHQHTEDAASLKRQLAKGVYGDCFCYQALCLCTYINTCIHTCTYVCILKTVVHFEYVCM